MLNLSPPTRVFVATAPVDLRGSSNALYARVQTQLQLDPLSGHLFVFTNTRRNRVKILFWDGSGRWLCAKRMEKNRFTWPATRSQRSRRVRAKFPAFYVAPDSRAPSAAPGDLSPDISNADYPRTVNRDMKLYSRLPGRIGIQTRSCVSPQVLHERMRLAGRRPVFLWDTVSATGSPTGTRDRIAEAWPRERTR